MRHSPAQLIRSTLTPIIIVALGLLTFGQIQAESAPEPAGVAVLLIEALQIDDSYVRQNAALALGRLPLETATPVLLAALESDDPAVRHRAAKILSTQDPNAWQNTWHLLVPAEPAPPATAVA